MGNAPGTSRTNIILSYEMTSRVPRSWGYYCAEFRTWCFLVMHICGWWHMSPQRSLTSVCKAWLAGNLPGPLDITSCYLVPVRNSFHRASRRRFCITFGQQFQSSTYVIDVWILERAWYSMDFPCDVVISPHPSVSRQLGFIGRTVFPRRITSRWIYKGPAGP